MNCLKIVVGAVQALRDRERGIDVEHGGQRLDARLDRVRAAARELLGRRGDERDRLVDVHHVRADRDERRLVVLDQRDHVLAGDVGSGDDRDLRPVERGIEVDRLEHAVRDRRAHRVAPYQRRERRGRRGSARGR